jgi:uncharacterized protein
MVPLELKRQRAEAIRSIFIFSNPLQIVAMKLTQLIDRHRTEILILASKHGARRVRIFGSVARGEADEKSDVDFLVDMEPGRSLMDMGGLLMDLKDLLGCNVDIVTEKGLKERIRTRILNEAVPL